MSDASEEVDDGEEDWESVDSDDLAKQSDEEIEDAQISDVEARVYEEKTKRVREEDEEADFEKKPRVNRKLPKENNRLPIISLDGEISQLEPRELRESDEEEKPKVSKKQKKGMTAPITNSEKPIPTEQIQNESYMKLPVSKIPEKIASKASSIIQDPETHIKGLRLLRELTKHKNQAVVKLAILSLLAVFKDIIPGYRIRADNEEEKGVKLSKEVKKLRDYETCLLNNYQLYLKELEGLIMDRSPKTEDLRVQAVRCMAELLVSATHFNYRSNILNVVINNMSDKQSQVSILCCNAISQLFVKDNSGQVSLEAVKLMSKMVKARSYKVSPETIQTLLHLRLKDELSLPTDNEAADAKSNDKKRKNKQPHMSKKMRKLVKEEKEVEKELKEAQAVIDQEEKQKTHTETLKFVFIMYFRILKDPSSKHLLAAVLTGLSQFAHLISVDFFQDLLNVLKTISRNLQEQGDSSGLDPKMALNCIVTVLYILSGQGEALNVDLKEFVDVLYELLVRIPSAPREQHVSAKTKEKEGDLAYISASGKSSIELALTGIELIFLKRKEVSMDRVGAFAKRLAAIAMQLPVNETMACLSVIKRMFIKYPRLESLLDPEGRLGSGMYRMFVEDSDRSEPFSTSFWELSVLANHYHPDVAFMARHLFHLLQFSASGTTHKPLPPRFTAPFSEIIYNYDSLKKGTFKFQPALTLPASIKRKRGIYDGFSVYSSQFDQ